MPRIVLFLCLLFFLGCEAEEKLYLGSWVELKQNGSNGLTANIRMEDIYGNCPTGARIYLTTPANELYWVPFSREYGLYRTNLTDIQKGNYRIEVESYIEDFSISAPMAKLETRPTILDIVDEGGSCSSRGEKLDSSGKIALTWERVADSTVYNGRISGVSREICSFNTVETSFVLDKNLLEEDSQYYLVLEAQYISGDPFLRNERYYSFCYTKSYTYSFLTE